MDDANQPVTKQDLQEGVRAITSAVQAEIKGLYAAISASEQRTNSRIEQLEHRIEQLEQRIEQVETSLLTEFHKWASPAEARAKTHAAAIRAIDAEMEFLSDRVAKLEGKSPQ
jgi:hypothetical protein